MICEFLAERLIEITKVMVSDEQGGFGMGKDCMNQVSDFRMGMESLGNSMKLHRAIMNLESTFLST